MIISRIKGLDASIKIIETYIGTNMSRPLWFMSSPEETLESYKREKIRMLNAYRDVATTNFNSHVQ